MSVLLAIGSDVDLDEIINEKVKTYSINQALKAGVDVDLSFLAGVDRDEEGVILWAENEEDFYAMEIRKIDKNEDLDYYSEKKFFYAFDCLNYSLSERDRLYDYLKKSLDKAGDLELISIWQGEMIPAQEKSLVFEELEKTMLDDFFWSQSYSIPRKIILKK